MPLPLPPPPPPHVFLAELPTWQPQGAPMCTPVFRVTYQEKGFPYVDEIYAVDLAGLRKALAQNGAGSDPVALLEQGKVASCVRMTFLVDIHQDRRRALVERNLRESWPGGTFTRGPKEVEAYLNWQGRSLNRGDRVEYFFFRGSAMAIRFNEGPEAWFRSEGLNQALRTIEYSDDPQDPGTMREFRKALGRALAPSSPTRGSGGRK
jgi:hypothetical protein